MSALQRNRYFAAARGRRDQRQRRISGEGNSPANRQSVRCGQPHAHAGKAARPAFNENATRAASAQTFPDHRDDPPGVAATDPPVPPAHKPFAFNQPTQPGPRAPPRPESLRGGKEGYSTDTLG